MEIKFTDKEKIKMEFTIDYLKSKDGIYIGILKEYPGVVSQAETVEELKENIKDSMRAMMAFKREEYDKNYPNK
jgi:predicted RNase H-like HicB family nuclease